MTSIPFAEVIGDPIAQSKSPLIHGFWLEQLQISAEYRRHQVRPGEIAAYLSTRRSDPDWNGCNVTMPLKLDALDLADEASDAAVTAGAANLLLPRGGRIIAGNTDVAAIATLVGRHLGETPPNVVLLGNGGAARGALVALRILGINTVTIHARDLAAATKLAVEFGLHFAPRPLDAPFEADGLINATPMGMGSNLPPPIELDGLPGTGWVFDMVTYPAETELLQRAQARGLTVITGLEMLVEQAADSFLPFFGVQAPRDRDPELFELLRS